MVGRFELRFERILSGQLSPLCAPFPLYDPPLLAPLTLHHFRDLRSPLRSRSPGFWPAPLRFPLSLRSYALVDTSLTGDYKIRAEGGLEMLKKTTHVRLSIGNF